MILGRTGLPGTRGAFIDQVEHANRPFIMSKGTHKVVRPDVIRSLRPKPHAGAVVESQPATRLLLLRNLQPFAPPDRFHTIFAHSRAGFAQLNRDASIAVLAISAGKCDDSQGQCVFVVPLCRLVKLRSAWLMDQFARMTLVIGMLHGGTASLRA